MDGETNGGQEATQGAQDASQQQGQGQQETQQQRTRSNFKYRALWLCRPFDYDTQDWAEAQEWIMRMLLRLRKTALTVHAG